MEDLQVALNSARVEQKNQGLWIRAWHVGQTLQALVVDKSPTMGTLLRVDGRQFVVPADIPVQKGAKLMLEVSHMVPAPTLKILQVSNPALAAAPIVHFAALSELSQKLTKQARSLIPKHGKTDKALLSLFGLSSGDVSPMQVNLIESLRQVISRSGDLQNSSDIAEALRSIGSFPNGHYKKPNFNSQLQKLADSEAALGDPSLTGNLQESIQAALAKLALNQTRTLQRKESGEECYYFDLPLWFNGGLVVAEIRLVNSSESHSMRWQFQCQIGLPEIGNVQAQVYLNENKISIALSSESHDFFGLIRENIEQLENNLSSAGISFSAVCCQSEPLFMPSVLDDFENVLDERA